MLGALGKTGSSFSNGSTDRYYAIRQVEDKRMCLTFSPGDNYDGSHDLPYLAPCTYDEMSQWWEFVEASAGVYSITSRAGSQYSLDGNVQAVSNYNPNFQNPFTSEHLYLGYSWYYWRVTITPHPYTGYCSQLTTLDFSGYLTYPTNLWNQQLRFRHKASERKVIPLKGITAGILNGGVQLRVQAYSTANPAIDIGAKVRVLASSSSSNIGDPCYSVDPYDVTGQFWGVDNTPANYFHKEYDYCNAIHWVNDPRGSNYDNLYVVVDSISSAADIFISVTLNRKCNIYEGSIPNTISIGATEAYSSIIRSGTGRYMAEVTDRGVFRLMNPGNPDLPVLWTNFPSGTSQPSGVYALQLSGNKIRIKNLSTNQDVWSANANGAVLLAMQEDGNLVAYNSGHSAVWSTGTASGQGTNNVKNKRMLCPGEVLKGGSGTQSYYDCNGNTCTWHHTLSNGAQDSYTFTTQNGFYCLYLNRAPMGQLYKPTIPYSQGAVIPSPRGDSPCTKSSCVLKYNNYCLEYYPDNSGAMPVVCA